MSLCIRKIRMHESFNVELISHVEIVQVIILFKEENLNLVKFPQMTENNQPTT
jgi:hypothetical protein